MTMPNAATLNYQQPSQQFATVSIPDLRNQQMEMLREDARSGLPPMATMGDDQLQQIQDAIRQSRDQTQTISSRKHAVTCDDWLGEQSEGNIAELKPLVDSIVQHYPAGGTPIISLISSEDNPQLAGAVARAAVLLQQEISGRLLMIDSDLENGGLTYHLQCVGKPGLVDMIGDNNKWSQCITTTSNASIDFIPVGRATLREPSDIKGWIGRSLPLFKQDYDYVMVSSGDAHTDQSLAWCSHANGSYLLVSMSTTNQLVAKSAVTHLRSHGARMLGCIVSDVH